MAKIEVEFDTKDKSLSVVLNGKKMKNVTDFAVFSFDGSEFRAEITSRESNEEDDTVKITRIIATDTDEEVVQEIDDGEFINDLGRALKLVK